MAIGLVITACEAIKKPIFSEIQVTGLGPFECMTEKVGNKIFSELIQRGYITSEIGYNAVNSLKKVVYLDKEDTSKSHEEFHTLMKQAKVNIKNFKDPAKGYFWMFDESAATAVNEYCLLLSAGNEKETIINSINHKRDFGDKTYDLVGRCFDLEEIAENEINELASKSFLLHEVKNWASMMIDLTYLGLLDPCYRVMEKFGLDKGQQELIDLAKELRDDSTADNFFRRLEESSGRTIKRIKPVREGLSCRGLLEYRDRAKQDNIFRVEFNGPKMLNEVDRYKFFIDIENSLLAEYKPELDRLGELCIKVHANELYYGQ